MVRPAEPTLVILAAAAGLAGCDPRWHLDARVSDPAGRPIPEARVEASCLPLDAYESDASGHVRASHFGAVHAGCILRVSKPGHRPVVLRAAEACREWNSWLVGGCRDLRIAATLWQRP